MRAMFVEEELPFVSLVLMEMVVLAMIVGDLDEKKLCTPFFFLFFFKKNFERENIIKKSRL